MDLFRAAQGPARGPGASSPGDGAPLAERMRPRTLDELVGQERLIGPGSLLRAALGRGELPSLVLWGPPGTGKTTLARILAREAGLPHVSFSAVTGGVKDVREIVQAARDERRLSGRSTVLFVDEIHRFNRAQQDAFLPHVEDGTIVLVGATTENPSFALNAALLSRLQVLVLEPLAPGEVRGVLERALGDPVRGLGRHAVAADPEALARIAGLSWGDVRSALNLLEVAVTLAASEPARRITAELVGRAREVSPLRHDRAGDQHYDLASALIKSLRGSDPDAAVYWLARLLEGGEDPRFLARRLVVFASEDVGNADPRALSVAVDVARAVELVGLPEARINLAQGATYLAMAPKSNASYVAGEEAREAVRRLGPLPVPLHLRNAPTGLMRELGYARGYQYAHDHPGGEVAQEHLPAPLRQARFYRPSDRGDERAHGERLERLRRLRAERGRGRGRGPGDGPSGPER